jgi:hypothetical protein
MHSTATSTAYMYRHARAPLLQQQQHQGGHWGHRASPRTIVWQPQAQQQERQRCFGAAESLSTVSAGHRQQSGPCGIAQHLPQCQGQQAAGLGQC